MKFWSIILSASLIFLSSFVYLEAANWGGGTGDTANWAPDGGNPVAGFGAGNISSGVFFLPDPWDTVSSTDPDSDTQQLNAANEYVGVAFSASRACDISSVHFRTGALTSSGTVDVSIETIDGSDGSPSGTLWDTNTNVTGVTVDTAESLYEAVLTADASVVQGDQVMVEILYGSGDFFIDISQANSLARPSFPYSVSDTGAGTDISTAPPNIGIECADGTWLYIPGALAINSSSLLQFDSDTTPDEIGNKFNLPVSVTVCGFSWTSFRSSSTGGFDITATLYDASDNELTSVSVDGDLGLTSNTERYFTYFPDNVIINANADYRLTITADTAVNSVSYYQHNMYEAAALETIGWGGNIQKTSRSDNGSWTDDVDSIVKVSMLVCGV